MRRRPSAPWAGRAALARHLLAGGHIDEIQGEIDELRAEGRGEIVATTLDDDHLQLRVPAGELVDGADVDGRILADCRVRAAAGFHADDPVFRQRLRPEQDLHVLLGVDVVGHHADVEAAAELPAELLDQRGLAGADGAADADAEDVSGHGFVSL